MIIKPKKIGIVSRQIIDILQLNIKTNTPIFIGESNIKHIIEKHRTDYEKYGIYIEEILSAPDYVGVNNKDQSIEYVKEFQINGDFVKVAIRISNKGTFFVRSLYALNKNRVSNFISKGTLKKVNK